MSALLNTITNNQPDQAFALLETEALINAQSDSGNTALHEAVARGYTGLAAAIIARGADLSILNQDKQAALDTAFSDLQTIHRIRQELQRLKEPQYLDESALDPEVEQTLRQLRRDGVVKISGLLTPNQVADIQQTFSAWGESIETKRARGDAEFVHYDQEEYWHEAHRSYVTNDAFVHSQSFAQVCCHPRLTTTANYYLGKAAHIKRAYFMRYLPQEPMDRNQFRWHHDMEDRQLKIMLLLSEVGEDDQFMSYIPGSHNAFHPYERFLKNALDFDYCESYLSEIKEFRTLGTAGDLFLFDSNGMHRGNRSEGRSRDALFVEFTTDGNQDNIWGSSVTPESLQEYPECRQLIPPFLAVEPKWKRKGQKKRKLPTWAHSLEHPALWAH